MNTHAASEKSYTGSTRVHTREGGAPDIRSNMKQSAKHAPKTGGESGAHGKGDNGGTPGKNGTGRKVNISTIILILVFVVGLALLLYPTISDWWNSQVQSRAIVNYDEVVANMSEEDYDSEFAKANAYNEAIASLANPLVSYEQVEGYDSILDVTGTGMMGYIEIPRIHMKLPIYHGISDAVLNVATGHLPGSSLPVGGKGTHCVISGHRGLPSSMLFTDLDKLEEGDRFTITVLNRLLTYEVDQIRIVEPDEIGDLAIEPGKDYVTLLTCTPYGINTQRLLVRGYRVPNDSDSGLQTEAYELDPTVLAPFVAALLLLVLLAALLVRNRRAKARTRFIDGEEKWKHD